jgi:hypothetical protein
LWVWLFHFEHACRSLACPTWAVATRSEFGEQRRSAGGSAGQGASRDRTPGKILNRNHCLPFPREAVRSFRYAPLSSGLDLVRKCLGQHEIATRRSPAAAVSKIERVKSQTHGLVERDRSALPTASRQIASRSPSCSSFLFFHKRCADPLPTVASIITRPKAPTR